LDTGAGLFQAVGLFEQDDTKAIARKGQSRGQPTDTGAPDNDNARRRQALLRRVLGDDVVQGALGGPCGIGRQSWIVAIKGGAIGADIFSVVAHVAKHVWMVVWRRGADAHELLRADLDNRNARIVMEVGYDFVAHAALLASCSVCRLDFGRTIATADRDS
jgi:hypothetical protein